ncbi:hypothetical protein PR003_g32790 [Phytophthora rubi]|uniref:Uncharacterized protein n=1 Tax=Phytophthora rubi TaxID=129364 RepID=A0A6A4AZR6_9STRA|nr:hypothetical protein PR002_g31465 [Phytophthora rubi]KAE9264479.1 hypothetical protein PR003_g32790 [Phytophthora rubi]
MTSPLTDSGGPDHRPPDPAAAHRHPPDTAAFTAAPGQASPPIAPAILGGPPKVTNSLSSGAEPAPALVTTPSDARGGEGNDPGTDSRGQHSAVQDNPGLGTAGSRRTVSYAAVVQQGGQQERTDKVAPPSNIAGTWTPRERHILLDTLTQDWSTSSAPTDTPEQAALRQVALAPSKVHADGALRERTEAETSALLHYLDRSLELPHPPCLP